MTTYTIECNGASHTHTEYPREQWAKIANIADTRGGINARLVRQDQLPRNRMTETISTAMVLDDCVICESVLMAEVRS